MLRFLLPLVFALSAATASFSATPFEEAVELWLAGDDENSLNQLANLARNGHPEARLLLARIETTDKAPSPFRRSLSKKDARALFRNMEEDALFGQSWLRTEAQHGDPLAALLLQANFSFPNVELIEALQKAGEFQATDRPLRVLALDGTDKDKLKALKRGMVLDELLPFFTHLSSDPEPQGDGLAALRFITGNPKILADDDAIGMAGVLALGYGYGDLSPENAWRKPVESWVMQAAATKPIADFCSSTCPDKAQAASCGFALLALSGGYFEVIRIDSPIENIIPQKDFLASPRARLMTLRRAALRSRDSNLARPAEEPQLTALSQCAATPILTERAKY